MLFSTQPSPAGSSNTTPAAKQNPAVVGIRSALTPREQEILIHVGRGATNAEIAAELYLSEARVKTHVSRILTKLDLRDRVQVVVLAYETGLIEPPHRLD